MIALYFVTQEACLKEELTINLFPNTEVPNRLREILVFPHLFMVSGAVREQMYLLLGSPVLSFITMAKFGAR